MQALLSGHPSAASSKPHPAIGELRKLLAEDSPLLEQKLDQAGLQLEDTEKIETRVKHAQNGALALALDIVRKNSPAHAAVIVSCIKFLARIVIPSDVDDPREDVPINAIYDLDGVSVYADSLMRSVAASPYPDVTLINALSWLVRQERGARAVLATGVQKALAKWAKDGFATIGEFAVERSLSVLHNASRHPSLRAQLAADGALDAALAHVKVLGSSALGDKLMAFRVSSILTRLLANEEKEPAKIVQGNAELIDKMVDFFNNVLDTGSKDAYLGIKVKPHSMTMDLLILSRLEANKPLLKGAVPVLVKALKLRGTSNPDMVVDIVCIFEQLSTDSGCLKAMMKDSKEITTFLEKHVVHPKYDVDARRSAEAVIKALLQG